MGVQEKGTGQKPESGKLRQPDVGETPPWTSNLLFPSLLQHGWMTQHKKATTKHEFEDQLLQRNTFVSAAGEQLHCLKLLLTFQSTVLLHTNRANERVGRK